MVSWNIKTRKDIQFDNSSNTNPSKRNTKNGGDLRCSTCAILRVTPVTNSWVRHCNFRSDDFSLTTRKPCVSSFHVSSNPLCRKSWWESQLLTYRKKRIESLILDLYLVQQYISFYHRSEIRRWKISKYICVESTPPNASSLTNYSRIEYIFYSREWNSRF